MMHRIWFSSDYPDEMDVDFIDAKSFRFVANGKFVEVRTNEAEFLINSDYIVEIDRL